MCPSKIRSVLTFVVAFPLMKMDWEKLRNECVYKSEVHDKFPKLLGEI